MTKQKRIWILLAALWVAAFICIGVTARSFRREPGLPAERTAHTAYIVRATDGYVAVYRTDAPGSPVQVTDIPVSELREHDQALLRKGLGVDSREALLMLLEDLKA